MEKSKDIVENMYSLAIDNLPDDVLLKIFEYIFFEDLCHCAQVSPKWRYLTQLLLIKEVVINRHLAEQDVHLLIKHPLITNHLESFKYLNDQITSFDMFEFQLLTYKCPNLKNLTLRKCLIYFAQICSLPASLKHLSLRLCEINSYDFFCLSNHEVKITCLDLSGVNIFTSEDMRLLLKLQSLRCLYLENCHRINSGGIEWIVDILPQLLVLDLEGTSISNEIIKQILFYGSELKELYLGHTSIDDDSFSDIILPIGLNLRWLCVKETNLSLVCIDTLICMFKDQVYLSNSFKTYSWNNNLGTSQNFQPVIDNEEFQGCYHYLNHVCPC